MLNFLPKYKSLREILTDQKLATLGDAYVNFIHSLALSKKRGEPTGARVDSHVLAKALKKAGLRDFLPSRTDRHKQADAVEALIVYAWIKDLTTIEDDVNILKEHEDPTEGFYSILVNAREKLTFTS